MLQRLSSNPLCKTTVTDRYNKSKAGADRYITTLLKAAVHNAVRGEEEEEEEEEEESGGSGEGRREGASEEQPRRFGAEEGLDGGGMCGKVEQRRGLEALVSPRRHVIAPYSKLPR